MCQSYRVLRFIDGFGQRRVFCKTCGRSFLEDTFIDFAQQRTLPEFRVGLHNKFLTGMVR